MGKEALITSRSSLVGVAAGELDRTAVDERLVHPFVIPVGFDSELAVGEGLIDLALVQLEEQGVVERDELDSKLADGEADLVIRWAEGGEHASVSDLRFRDME
ncbi:hypothetical protein [Botrimarina hoheduenensis]|uniref:Uncharacterized protein n=1 Tax=Botrimarina hoheduenensis TaxID=2528000 RepID=A0A5C5WDF5_9BACT|nr:hypothetical protein [Botrimarina hoheduenensis]TWT48976.1 hypothetical protein Pla111_07540 [Botrimarina hoheduenensis]